MTHGNVFRRHIDKRDVHRVRVQGPGERGPGRYWLFTFSDAWGPMLTDEWGEPVDNTPLADEEHPFWDKFEAWQAAHEGRRRALAKPLG